MPSNPKIFVNFAFQATEYLKNDQSTQYKDIRREPKNFENPFVVVTGFGRPSDATMGFSVYNEPTIRMKATDKNKLIDRIKTLEGLTDDERSALLGLLNETKTYGLVW